MCLQLSSIPPAYFIIFRETNAFNMLTSSISLQLHYPNYLEPEKMSSVNSFKRVGIAFKQICKF